MSPQQVVIVGGGVSGMASAFFLVKRARAQGRPVEVTLLEGSGRLGGILGTDHEGGFLLEHAADQFLYQQASVVGLIRDLGLEGELIAPNRVHPAIHVWARGALRAFPKGMPLAIPSELLPFLGSDLLSWRGKLRVLRELWMGQDKGVAEDESMWAFFSRRFGQELADAVVGPVLAGIYSGDPTALSIQATFPRFPAMVRAHGSALLGSLLQARTSTGSPFRTFRGGMGALVEGLAKALGELPEVSVRLNARVLGLSHAKVTKGGGRVDVALEGGERLEGRQVVLALPTAAARKLVQEDFGGVAWNLDGFESTSSGGMYLAFERASAPQVPQTIGMLMPRSQEWTIRGVSIASQKFVGRAPADHHLLRVFLGGEGHAQVIDLPDEVLLERVLGDLRRMIGLTAAPTLVRVRRYRQQTPQYRVGHLDQVALLQERMPPGLRLVGNAYSGVGVPACVQMGYQLAEALLPSAAGLSAAG
jgi:protoporphyrinogen/coproporphyrinogen III oxidase